MHYVTSSNSGSEAQGEHHLPVAAGGAPPAAVARAAAAAGEGAGAGAAQQHAASLCHVQAFLVQEMQALLPKLRPCLPAAACPRILVP